MTTVAAEMTWSEFMAEGKKRFGENRDEWRFVCIACGHVQSIGDFMRRHPGEKREDVANWIFLSCEGRRDKSVGCNWALGGLLHLQERMLVETGTETDKCPVFLFDGETTAGKPFYTPREKAATKDHPHDK